MEQLGTTSGVFATRTRLWRSNRYGDLLDVIADTRPITGSVNYNYQSDIKRRFSVEMIDPQTFRALRDYIIPELTLIDASGTRHVGYLGHFLLNKPTMTLRPGSAIGSFEADDVTILLKKERLNAGFRVEAGRDLGDAARQLASAVGFRPSQINLPNTGVKAKKLIEYEPGEEVYAVMNNLYNRSGYYDVVANGRGVLETQRWLSVAKPNPVRTYRNYGPDIQIIPPVEEESPDWSQLANEITVKNITPDEDPIYYTARVTNTNSPVHERNIGMVMAAEPINDPDIESNAQAKERAQEELLKHSSLYRRVTLKTVVDVNAGAHDVIALDIRQGSVALVGKWLREEWTIELGGEASTITQTLNRAEEWDNDLDMSSFSYGYDPNIDMASEAEKALGVSPE